MAYTGKPAGSDLYDVYTQTDVDNGFVAKDGSGNVTVTGAFTSQGIDDNAISTSLTIDSAGRVTMPYQPCVAGRVSHYNTSGAKGGAGQCQLYDDGSVACFSHGLTINNNSVTVPVDGVYHIQAEQLNIGDALYFNIYINGVSVKHGYINTGGPFFGDYNVTATIYLSSNDIITLGYQNSSSDRWEGPHSCFSVFKIA